MAHSKQTCPSNKAVIAACTSGGAKDCGSGRVSHYVDCSTASLIDVPSNAAWKAVNFEYKRSFWGTTHSAIRNTNRAWARCATGEAIFSRCASGGDPDCSIPGEAHHGIKCGKLSKFYEFTEPQTSRWVCENHGGRAECPANHVAVSSCGSSSWNDCEAHGCKNRKETFTGLECKKYRLKPTRAPTRAPTKPPSPIPSINPSMDPCLESTLALLEATRADYDDTGVRNNKFTVNGKESEIVDFTTNGAENAVFKVSCEDEGGRYVELKYEAICTTLSRTVTVIVQGHPRCYATVCKVDDEQILFEDFTLRLTEERNNGDWTCTGELKEEVLTGTPGENPQEVPTGTGKPKQEVPTLKQEVQTGCEVETDLVNDSEALVRENYVVKPNVEDIKFLYIFTRVQQLVTFPNAEAFRDACTEGGFKPVQVAQSNIACDEAEFEVQDFSVCLGKSCRDDEQGYIDAIAAAQFQKKMAGNLPNPEAVCTMTSDALSASRGFIAIGTMVLGLFWHLVL